jgi:murein DD-endopeptidase MepM/ murein hydrolase activator NlpD
MKTQNTDKDAVNAPADEEAPHNNDWAAPQSDHLTDDSSPVVAKSGPQAQKDTSSRGPAPSCNAADLTFTVWPLDGANGKAWMINNYLDLNSNPTATRDYQNANGSEACTYDGHTGIDIDLPSFREMDNGTAIVRAAAPGTVEDVREDQFDRNTSCTGSWNFVRIQHANGYDSIYGHLKKNSVMVKKGDVVIAGQAIGIAGSSGCSTAPHLHFEVRDCAGAAVEPFQLGMWSAPPTYSAPSDVLDVMLRKGNITTPQVKDPAPDPVLFKPGETLGIGLSMCGKAGDEVKMSLLNPAGAIADKWKWTVPTTVSRYMHLYPTWSKVISATPGKWTFEVQVNSRASEKRAYKVSTYDPNFCEVAKHKVSAASYQSVFTDITAAGYRPVWVDGYEVNGEVFYNAVFRPADRVRWIARHGLTHTDYQAQFDNLPDGYRPWQVESFLFNGSVCYAVIFTKEEGPKWIAYHGKTEAEHVALFNLHTQQQGYRPVNVSVVSANGTRRVTALYDKANVGKWVAKHKIPASEYNDEFRTNKEAGRYLSYLNGYRHEGAVYFSAVWNSVSYGAYEARHGLSAGQYQNEWEKLTGAGYRTQIVTGYESGDAHTFASLWTH